MWGWLEGIFEWLGDQLGPYLRGIVDNLRRFKWFAVSLVAALLAPINWILDWLASSAQFVYDETAGLFVSVQSLEVGSSSSMWGALASGASLMNCVVPLDYAVALGSLCFAYLLTLGILRAAIWVYKLIPFKAS